ncbi:hypothetical protein [Olsenella intestinalis]|uniref:hypothetical protein n=1 Tax=Olsenella intestinalis TaxID=2930083 RepID=UPI00200DD00B|nr:hypothetical protein [Olsenella intestinalis]
MCYVDLTILRLLQRATGVPAARVRKELAAMSCSALDANWWLFDHRTDESDAILEAVGPPELRRKNMTTADVRGVFAKAKRAGVSVGLNQPLIVGLNQPIRVKHNQPDPSIEGRPSNLPASPMLVLHHAGVRRTDEWIASSMAYRRL